MTPIKLTVTKPVGLLDFLREKFPDTSRTKLKGMLAYRVLVNGERTSQFDFPLQAGMEVTITQPTSRDRHRNSKFDIVYEDRFLVVVNKREGLVSYSKRPGDETLMTLLNKYFEATHQTCRAHVVHRLDRDTSGLMIVAKTKELSRKFEEDWKNIVYDRAYVAVSWGRLSPQTGTITSWLTDGPYCVLSSPTDNGGKLAVTHYRTLQTSSRFSLLELKLDTGRRNQIRVHLRSVQHPVVHDPLYGYKNDVAPVDRLALHAYRLCFTHPILRRKMKFTTPVPGAFTRLLESE